MGERWNIHFQSNGQTDSERVTRAIDEKATDVCAGEYTIEQTTGGPQSNTYTNAGNGRTYTNHSTDTTSVIRCKE